MFGLSGHVGGMEVLPLLRVIRRCLFPFDRHVVVRVGRFRESLHSPAMFDQVGIEKMFVTVARGTQVVQAEGKDLGRKWSEPSFSCRSIPTIWHGRSQRRVQERRQVSRSLDAGYNLRRQWAVKKESSRLASVT